MTMKVPEMSCKFFIARTPELDLHAGTDCARDRAMTRVFSLLPSLCHTIAIPTAAVDANVAHANAAFHRAR